MTGCCGMGCEYCREVAAEVELADPPRCAACGTPARAYLNKVMMGDLPFCSHTCANRYRAVRGVLDS